VKKNYENWSTFVEVIERQSLPGTFDAPCTHAHKVNTYWPRQVHI